jgi:hypothetical protein
MSCCEYITLTELGVGSIFVKYSDIISIELTGPCASRITLSNGYTKIVAEEPCEIVRIITRTKKLCEN